MKKSRATTQRAKQRKATAKVAAASAASNIRGKKTNRYQMSTAQARGIAERAGIITPSGKLATFLR